MPGHVYCMCGNSRVKDLGVSFHRFPANAEKRAVWLRVFELQEEDIKLNSRVCISYFLDGNVNNPPVLTISKCFASPIKTVQGRSVQGKETKINVGKTLLDP